MIEVHHLNNSRSQRILWLLEELGAPYEVVKYRRDPVTMLAPPELKAAHPLGKAPVLRDGDRAIAESGAIIEYVIDRYGEGRLRPDRASPDHAAYVEWLHYAEGSAMLPLMIGLYVGRLGEAGAPLVPRIGAELANHLAYTDRALRERDYLVGENLTGADIQMTFVLEAAKTCGQLAGYAALTSYVTRMQARPAYRRAIERGGEYTLGQ